MASAVEGDITDGRTLRSMRTRSAVVEALLSLIREGDLRPTAPRIAERAGVSLRSVFQHFNDLGALHAAVAERQLAEVEALTQPIDRSLPLGERIDAFLDQRAAVLEAVTPVRRAQLASPLSSEGQAGFEWMRARTRAETEQAFAAELAAMAEGVREETLEAIDLVTSWQAWEGLRNYQRLGIAEATGVVRRIIERLLTA